MKRYLMAGMAAVVFAATFTSCSKTEVYSEEKAKEYEQQKNQMNEQNAYDQAFVKAFGEVNPNQTWGFGPNDGKSSSSRAMTRATMPTQPTFADETAGNKPSKPTFSNTVPEGTPKIDENGNYQNGSVVYMDASSQIYNKIANTDGLVIYISGDVSYSGNTNQNGGTTFIVTDDSKLTLSNVSNKLSVYLSPKATLNLSNNVTFGHSALLYLSEDSKVTGKNVTFDAGYQILNDKGTFEADNIYVNTNHATFWNYGTMKATNEIGINNSSAELINNGTMTAAKFSHKAGGKMHNATDGVVNISGESTIDNSNSQWMNDGEWTTQSFELTGSAKQIYNNCKLTVTGNFHMNRGDFVLNGGASVVTNTFTWEDTSNFWMGAKSLVSVAGRLLTKNYNSGYGFRGVGSEYAVIKANSIEIESNEQFRMSYFGNLFIDTKNHFGQWYKDAPNTNQPCYYYENTVKFSFNNDASPVTIPSSKCNPGYQGGSKANLRIIAEDLNAQEASDFDFNDVVLDVYFGDAATAKVVVLAAGGIYPLYVNHEEVHGKFGEDTSTMINTHATGGKDGLTAQPIMLGFAVNSNAEAANILIQVDKGSGKLPLSANQGKAASKIAVGTDFEWCNERQDIDAKYNKKFSNYVQNGGDWDKWYK